VEREPVAAVSRRVCVVHTGDEHQRVQESVGLYLLGTALPPADRAAVEEHMATCRDCTTESDRLAEAVLSLAVFTTDERHALIDAYGAPPPVPPKGFGSWLLAGTVAVFVAVAVAVLFF
jgi:anti-sigma factor RsiW